MSWSARCSSPAPVATNKDSRIPPVPDFVVFSYDGSAGRAEPIAATTPDDAVAQVLTAYPGAITSVVPAEALEGCNRTRLLWEWVGMVEER